VQSAVDGFNVCIFAYGQTGSGKTYTLQGTQDQPGLTPRSIVKVFDIVSNMSNSKVNLSCTMVELYMNQLTDLLLPQDEEIRPLEVRDMPNGMVEIVNVTEVPIKSVSQAEEIFESGLNGRKVHETNMNDASSRSHLVYSIKIDVYNPSTKARTIGKLSFLDLAGSEKHQKTNSDKASHEEAHAVN